MRYKNKILNFEKKSEMTYFGMDVFRQVKGNKAFWFDGRKWIYDFYKNFSKRKGNTKGMMNSDSISAPCPTDVPTSNWIQKLRHLVKNQWKATGLVTVICSPE